MCFPIFVGWTMTVACSTIPSKRCERRSAHCAIFSIELFWYGFTWMDARTHSTLKSAGDIVYSIEKQQIIKKAFLEEITFNKGWIGNDEVKRAVAKHSNTEYAQYLRKLVQSCNS